MVGMALVTCLSLGFVTITHLRNKALTANLETVTNTNKQLVETVHSKDVAINSLIAQRKIDDKLVQHVFDQYTSLNKENEAVQTKLEELAKHDPDLKDILDQRHPESIGGLLNAYGSNQAKSDKVSSTSGAQEGL